MLGGEGQYLLAGEDTAANAAEGGAGREDHEEEEAEHRNLDTWSRMSSSAAAEGSEPFSASFWDPAPEQSAALERFGSPPGKHSAAPEEDIRTSVDSAPGGLDLEPEGEQELSFSAQMEQEEAQARLALFWEVGEDSGGPDMAEPSDASSDAGGGGGSHAGGVKSGGLAGRVAGSGGDQVSGVIDSDIGWHGSDGEFVPPHVARLQEDAARRRALTPAGPVPRPSENRRLALHSQGGARRVALSNSGSNQSDTQQLASVLSNNNSPEQPSQASQVQELVEVALGPAGRAVAGIAGPSRATLAGPGQREPQSWNSPARRSPEQVGLYSIASLSVGCRPLTAHVTGAGTAGCHGPEGRRRCRPTGPDWWGDC